MRGRGEDIRAGIIFWGGGRPYIFTSFYLKPKVYGEAWDSDQVGKQIPRSIVVCVLRLRGGDGRRDMMIHMFPLVVLVLMLFY